MGQGMRVTAGAAMRARDVSRVRAEDETPKSASPPEPVKPRRGEKRRLAKRRAAAQR